MSSLAGAASSIAANRPLTSTEISAGLKEALSQGVTNGVKLLSANNGFYSDMAVRIGLPPEALVITENISRLPGGEALVSNVIKSINAAASDAAAEAAPIFANAIRNMSFTDATKILAGGKDAATQYFKRTTNDELKRLFASKINTSLNKKLVGEVSAASSWNTLTSKWNDAANTLVGKVAGLRTVNTDLSDYLTQKALDGMYAKIADQEANIRSNASARTTTLLKRVFGHK